MRKFLISLFITLLAVASAWSQEKPGAFIRVAGGAFKNPKSNFQEKVTLPDFHIGKYEVTQKEWIEVMGDNPSQFKGDDLPVEMVSWYDSVEYCNKRSLKEGLSPYYNIQKDRKDPNNTNAEDALKWTVTINAGANGYRLPTEAEWEYAAGGGQLSKGFTYSGGNDADKVAWYWQNSGDTPLTGGWNWPAIEQNKNRSKPVGGKEPNELGLFDMSGNVREWCWDWLGDPENKESNPQGNPSGSARVWKGGGWMGADFCGEPSFRAGFEASSVASDQGLRVCRNR
jgi:sulfatase modifying factor 1